MRDCGKCPIIACSLSPLCNLSPPLPPQSLLVAQWAFFVCLWEADSAAREPPLQVPELSKDSDHCLKNGKWICVSVEGWSFLGRIHSISLGRLGVRLCVFQSLVTCQEHTGPLESCLPPSDCSFPRYCLGPCSQGTGEGGQAHFLP